MDIKTIIMSSKFYMQRASTYLSVFNACMILFLAISKLNEYGFNIPVSKYYIPIILLGAGLLILVGYIDTKLKFYENEVNIINKNNVYNAFVIEKLNSIEKKLEMKDKK